MSTNQGTLRIHKLDQKSPSLFRQILMLAWLSLTAMSAAHASDTPWVGTWAAATQPALPFQLVQYREQSLRLIVRSSIGGQSLRLRISNQYGDQPLQLGAVSIALRGEAANLVPGSVRPVLFGGQTSALVPPHSTLLSDAVELQTAPLSDLAISLYLPQATVASTTHTMALQTSYVAGLPGNHVLTEQFPAPAKITDMPFLVGVEVQASKSSSAAILVLGDSSIDGDGTNDDQYQRSTDALARRLQAARGDLAELGVLNVGIFGNRLLHDSPVDKRNPVGPAFGEAALKRLDMELQTHAGVRYLILSSGKNDIGFPGAFAAPAESVQAAQLIAGYTELIARARRAGVEKVVGTTLSPFAHSKIKAGYYTPAKEKLRQQVNQWLRSGKTGFDMVVDVDAVVRDPKHPARLLPAYDSGDHSHPNGKGYAAVAAAIPLQLFEPKRR